LELVNKLNSEEQKNSWIYYINMIYFS
jgi:hypothetical protein